MKGGGFLGFRIYIFLKYERGTAVGFRGVGVRVWVNLLPVLGRHEVRVPTKFSRGHDSI